MLEIEKKPDNNQAPVLEQISWRDPRDGTPLEPRIIARDYAGRPLTGALVRKGTGEAYPVVRGVARMTPALAYEHRAWLGMMGLRPPSSTESFQAPGSVDSFGFQWNWDDTPRTQQDLDWRVFDRHGLAHDTFRDRITLDAGSGAGDQTRRILEGGAKAVISIDLSDAIEVTARKMEGHPNWIGVQGDLTMLPFADGTFDAIYCEGVIQHTQDSQACVNELLRALALGGRGVATHYGKPKTFKQRVQHGIRKRIRRRLSRKPEATILLASGILAAGTKIPLIGGLWGKTFAVTNPRMPTFQASWSCTYDSYGHHAFQRFITTDEFRALFDAPGIDHHLSPDSGVLFYKHK